MKKTILLILLTAGFRLAAQQLTLDEILDGFERSIAIPDATATLSVKLIAVNGEEREIVAKAYQKQISDVQVDRLFLFDEPASVRDTGILIHSFMNGDENVMWIYLPAVKRVKRVALATSGGGYFMGSDFAYSDFIAKSRDDFIQEYLGVTVLDGTPCYTVKEYGKTLRQRQELKQSYMINYYRTTDFIMFGRDYYDLAGDLLKEYRVKKSVNLGGPYVYPTKIEMLNRQTGHKSVIEFTELSTDSIPERYFSNRFLQTR